MWHLKITQDKEQYRLFLTNDYQQNTGHALQKKEANQGKQKQEKTKGFISLNTKGATKRECLISNTRQIVHLKNIC